MKVRSEGWCDWWTRERAARSTSTEAVLGDDYGEDEEAEQEQESPWSTPRPASTLGDAL